jgi:hypothetical protein
MKMKKISLSIAAAAISMAGSSIAFAAELPTYEVAGFPVSPVQARLTGAGNIEEKSPASNVAISPHQLNVLTPRPKLTTATAASRQTDSGLRVR